MFFPPFFMLFTSNSNFPSAFFYSFLSNFLFLPFILSLFLPSNIPISCILDYLIFPPFLHNYAFLPVLFSLFPLSSFQFFLFTFLYLLLSDFPHFLFSYVPLFFFCTFLISSFLTFLIDSIPNVLAFFLIYSFFLSC